MKDWLNSQVIAYDWDWVSIDRANTEFRDSKPVPDRG